MHRDRFLGVCLSLFFGLWLLNCCACSGNTCIIRVGEEEVPTGKARLYLKMTLDHYEEMASGGIWDVAVDGRKAYEAACEAALSSLIRNAVVYQNLRPSQKVLTAEETELVEKACADLSERWAEDLKNWDISVKELAVYLSEDYCVSKFLSSMSYIIDSDELKAETAEQFIWYDNVSIEEYMKRIGLNVIMIYTGSEIGGEWVSFSPDLVEEQQSRAQNALEDLENGMSFLEAMEKYSEVSCPAEALPFQSGLIRTEQQNVIYQGQIERDLWDAIFRIPDGEVSGILQSRYGYLIVQVWSYPESGSEEEYKKSLSQLKEAYYQKLILQQTGKGVEKIVTEWQEETEITMKYVLWQRLIADLEPQTE